MATPVIQYGLRDDDDDMDCHRSSSKLFAPLKKLKKGKKLGKALKDTRTLLKGASSSMSMGFEVYGMDDDDSDESESESSYESEDDDDASVCSKASVASRAGSVMKKLGSSFRGAVTVSKHKETMTVPRTLSLDNTTTQDSDSDDAHSVVSRSSVVRKVKGTFSKAKKVLRRRSKHDKDEYDSDSDLSSSEEEEDLFSEKPRRLQGLKRSMSLQKDKPGCIKALPRRSISAGSHPHMLKQLPNDDVDSDLSDHDDCFHKSYSTPYHNNNESFVLPNDWSMNISPELNVSCSSLNHGGNHWDHPKKNNGPTTAAATATKRNLLAVGDLKNHGTGRAC